MKELMHKRWRTLKLQEEQPQQLMLTTESIGVGNKISSILQSWRNASKKSVSTKTLPWFLCFPPSADAEKVPIFLSLLQLPLFN
jgi:hypothetical protein